jgi:lactoylglutathione lyase
VRLDHVGVHVVDLERSIAFYRDVLGLRVEARFSLGDEQLVFLASELARIELIFDGTGQRPSGALDHVALHVDDVDAWLGRLRTAGARIIDEVPLEISAIEARIAFVAGPDGERIELIQRSTTEGRN